MYCKFVFFLVKEIYFILKWHNLYLLHYSSNCFLHKIKKENREVLQLLKKYYKIFWYRTISKIQESILTDTQGFRIRNGLKLMILITLIFLDHEYIKHTGSRGKRRYFGTYIDELNIPDLLNQFHGRIAVDEE